MQEYKHYSDYPMEDWHWPNFTPFEMRCRGDNKLMIHAPSMDKLQRLRELLNKPIPINSGYRSPEYNATLDGAATNSMHLKAQAYDVPMAGFNPSQFEAAAREVGFTGFGFYKKSNFMHIDTGRARNWGARWFPWAMFYGGDVPQADMAQMPEPITDTPITVTTKGTAITVAVGGVLAAIALFWDKIEIWIGNLGL